MSKTQNGKYEILYETYERWGAGNLKKASFSAKDDFEALKKVASHCGLYADEDDFFESEEEARAAGREPGEEETFIRGQDPEDIANEMQNCDGQDFIFYIKRPDGSYLYDSGETPEDCDDEWDD